MLLRIMALLSIVFSIFSCGDGTKSVEEHDAGTEASLGTFSGTVAGQSLTVRSAVFGETIVFGRFRGTEVILSDVPDLCDAITANRTPKNATFFRATMFIRDFDNELVSPGAMTYTVIPSVDPLNDEPFYLSGKSIASFSRNNDNCQDTLPSGQGVGISGFVKVDEIYYQSGGKMSATFDVTLGDQKDKVKGSVSADYCDKIWVYGPQPSCE